MNDDNGNHAATPGPWRITGQPRFGGRHKAIVGGPAQIDVADACGPTIKIANANARLIAAAPETAAERDRLQAINAELVTALEETVKHLSARVLREGMPISVEKKRAYMSQISVCDKARAALDKARKEG